jgi:hypothetical protein
MEMEIVTPVEAGIFLLKEKEFVRGWSSQKETKVVRDLSDKAIENMSLSDLRSTLKYLRDRLDNIVNSGHLMFSFMGDEKELLMPLEHLSENDETIPQNMLIYLALIDGIYEMLVNNAVDTIELSREPIKPWKHLISNGKDDLLGWYLEDLENGTYKEVYFK